MSLRRYGILLKSYLKEVKPIKYSKLTIDGTLMDYLLEEEKYLYEFADILRKILTQNLKHMNLLLWLSIIK